MLIFRIKNIWKNDFLVAAWIMAIVGMAQFAFLAEYKSGNRLMLTGNWIGGYLMALSLLFIFTTVEFLKWLQETENDRRWERFKTGLASVLLALHTFSGVYYLVELTALYGGTKIIWYTE